MSNNVQDSAEIYDLPSQMASILSQRFNKVIEVPPLPSICTQDNLTRWERFNLKPVFLPNEEIRQILTVTELKDWIKLNDRFYRLLDEGRIARDSAWLLGDWVLADFTDLENNTSQEEYKLREIYKDDPLSPVIERLRWEGKIGKLTNKYWQNAIQPGSRFAITHYEWGDVVCPAIAKKLGIREVRLERAIEFNAIANLYHPNRNKFLSQEFFEDIEDIYTTTSTRGEMFLSCHGSGSFGGETSIGATAGWYRFVNFAARPLGILSGIQDFTPGIPRGRRLTIPR